MPLHRIFVPKGFYSSADKVATLAEAITEVPSCRPFMLSSSLSSSTLATSSLAEKQPSACDSSKRRFMDRYEKALEPLTKGRGIDGEVQVVDCDLLNLNGMALPEENTEEERIWKSENRAVPREETEVLKKTNGSVRAMILDKERSLLESDVKKVSGLENSRDKEARRDMAAGRPPGKSTEIRNQSTLVGRVYSKHETLLGLAPQRPPRYQNPRPPNQTEAPEPLGLHVRDRRYIPIFSVDRVSAPQHSSTYGFAAPEGSAERRPERSERQEE
ncbi:hypothetical protein B0H11DRAFT_1919959 [Mycena galericulata]|nr:hypothetical protein B0H11DRAFT_1919959 [Mycena galericulata]